MRMEMRRVGYSLRSVRLWQLMQPLTREMLYCCFAA